VLRNLQKYPLARVDYLIITIVLIYDYIKRIEPKTIGYF